MVLEVIHNIPRTLELSDWAREEFRRTEVERIERESASMWRLLGARDEVIAIVGIYAPDLVGVLPEMWLLLTEDFRRNLRYNLVAAQVGFKQILSLYPQMMVRIDAESPLGTKFAEFYGFKKAQKAQQYHGRDYLVYEVSV